MVKNMPSTLPSRGETRAIKGALLATGLVLLAIGVFFVVWGTVRFEACSGLSGPCMGPVITALIGLPFFLIGLVVSVYALASPRSARFEEDGDEELERWLHAQLSGGEALPKSPPKEDE